MSNSLSAALKTGHHIFHQRVANYQAWWMRLTDPIVQDKPQYEETSVHGLTTYSAVAASPTPADIGAEGSTTSISAFEEVVKLSLKEARDTPSLITNTYMRLADLWFLTLSRAIKAAIVALDTTTHPLNGAASGVLAAQGGGTVYCADAFVVDPLNISSFNQQNLLTTAFSASALSAALANRWEYLDLSGNETMTGEVDEERPYLVGPSDLETDMTDVWERRGEIYDGSGLQSGSFRERLRDKPVVLPGSTSDANDWWLWWKRTIADEDGNMLEVGPFAPVIRTSPRVTVTEADSSHHIYVKGYGEYGLHYFTDCDQRVIMNKVA